MKRPQISVIKVGGSLFDWDLLPVELDRWLSRQNHHCQLLVAGGGGGTIRGGRLLNPRRAVSMSRLHLALLQRLGVDIDRFGEADRPIELS